MCARRAIVRQQTDPAEGAREQRGLRLLQTLMLGLTEMKEEASILIRHRLLQSGVFCSSCRLARSRGADREALQGTRPAGSRAIRKPSKSSCWAHGGYTTDGKLGSWPGAMACRSRPSTFRAADFLTAGSHSLHGRVEQCCVGTACGTSAFQTRRW